METAVIRGDIIQVGTEFKVLGELDKTYVVSEITEDGDIIYLSQRSYAKFVKGLPYSNPQHLSAEDFESIYAGYASE